RFRLFRRRNLGRFFRGNDGLIGNRLALLNRFWFRRPLLNLFLDFSGRSRLDYGHLARLQFQKSRFSFHSFNWFGYRLDWFSAWRFFGYARHCHHRLYFRFRLRYDLDCLRYRFNRSRYSLDWFSAWRFFGYARHCHRLYFLCRLRYDLDCLRYRLNRFRYSLDWFSGWRLFPYSRHSRHRLYFRFKLPYHLDWFARLRLFGNFRHCHHGFYFRFGLGRNRLAHLFDKHRWSHGKFGCNLGLAVCRYLFDDRSHGGFLEIDVT